MNSEPAEDDGPSRFRSTPVSFVRRSARLSTGRQRAWDRYHDKYLVEVPRALADTSVDPEYVFDAAAAFGRAAPLTVEIGSGMGEAVISAAEHHPERNFLAVEVYTPGVAQTLMHIGKRDIGNIRLMQANAPEVLETALPAGSVSELWVFFPDPWHKTKHHKRRLVSPRFTELAARVLRPGGVWRLATDWAGYARAMRDVVDASPDFVNLHAGERATSTDSAGGWAPRFEGRVLTSFEQKAAAAGRQIHDLTYQRV